jgi:hypothetical protein
MFGGIAVARNLLCLAYSEARGKVFLVDLDERRTVSFWEYGQENGYADAGGVAMAPDFSLYVADTRNDLVRWFTPFGVEIGRLGATSDRGPGAARRDQTGILDRPRSVAIHDSTVYVACGEQELRRGVQRFRRDGSVLEPLRAFGEVEGMFGAPQGLFADDLGIVVADTLHGLLQRFGPDGRFIGQVSTATPQGPSSRPVAVVRLADGDLLVADRGDQRGLARFSVDGEPRRWKCDAEFDGPIDLARDRKDRIYVLDRDGERVQRLHSGLGFDTLIVDVAEIQHGT